MRENHFEKMYLTLRSKNKDVVEIDKGRLELLEESYIFGNVKFPLVVAYISLIIFSFFFFLGAPLFLIYSYSFSCSVESQIYNMMNQRDVLISYNNLPTIYLSIFFFSIGYLAFFPNNFLNRQTKSYEDSIGERIPESALRWFQLVSFYIIVFVPIVFAISFQLVSADAIRIFLRIWLLWPFFALGIALIILSPILISYLLIKFFYNKKKVSSYGFVAFEIGELLCKIHLGKEKIVFQENLRRVTIKSILRIGNYIKELGSFGDLNETVSYSAFQKMKNAGENFASLAMLLYFPKPNSVELLAESLTAHFNGICSGNYEVLLQSPSKNLSNEGLKPPEPRFMRFLLLMIFVILQILPIMVSAYLSSQHNTIYESVKAFQGTIYLFWFVLIFIVFFESLGSDVRDIIRDMFKIAFGKE